MLDEKYEPEDLKKYVDACIYLTSTEQNLLYMLLKEFEELFNGTLGC